MKSLVPGFLKKKDDKYMGGRSNMKFTAESVVPWVDLLEAMVRKKLKNPTTPLKAIDNKLTNEVIEAYLTGFRNRTVLDKADANVLWSAVTKVIKASDPILSDRNCTTLQIASSLEVSQLTSYLPVAHQQVLGALFRAAEMLIRLLDAHSAATTVDSLASLLIWNSAPGSLTNRHAFCNLIHAVREDFPYCHAFEQKLFNLPQAQAQGLEPLKAEEWIEILGIKPSDVTSKQQPQRDAPQGQGQGQGGDGPTVGPTDPRPSAQPTDLPAAGPVRIIHHEQPSAVSSASERAVDLEMLQSAFTASALTADELQALGLRGINFSDEHADLAMLLHKLEELQAPGRLVAGIENARMKSVSQGVLAFSELLQLSLGYLSEEEQEMVKNTRISPGKGRESSSRQQQHGPQTGAGQQQAQAQAPSLLSNSFDDEDDPIEEEILPVSASSADKQWTQARRPRNSFDSDDASDEMEELPTIYTSRPPASAPAARAKVAQSLQSLLDDDSAEDEEEERRPVKVIKRRQWDEDDPPKPKPSAAPASAAVREDEFGLPMVQENRHEEEEEHEEDAPSMRAAVNKQVSWKRRPVPDATVAESKEDKSHAMSMPVLTVSREPIQAAAAGRGKGTFSLTNIDDSVSIASTPAASPVKSKAPGEEEDGPGVLESIDLGHGSLGQSQGQGQEQGQAVAPATPPAVPISPMGSSSKKLSAGRKSFQKILSVVNVLGIGRKEAAAEEEEEDEMSSTDSVINPFEMNVLDKNKYLYKKAAKRIDAGSSSGRGRSNSSPALGAGTGAPPPPAADAGVSQQKKHGLFGFFSKLTASADSREHKEDSIGTGAGHGIAVPAVSDGARAPSPAALPPPEAAPDAGTHEEVDPNSTILSSVSGGAQSSTSRHSHSHSPSTNSHSSSHASAGQGSLAARTDIIRAAKPHEIAAEHEQHKRRGLFGKVKRALNMRSRSASPTVRSTDKPPSTQAAAGVAAGVAGGIALLDGDSLTIDAPAQGTSTSAGAAHNPPLAQKRLSNPALRRPLSTGAGPHLQLSIDSPSLPGPKPSSSYSHGHGHGQAFKRLERGKLAGLLRAQYASVDGEEDAGHAPSSAGDAEGALSPVKESKLQKLLQRSQASTAIAKQLISITHSAGQPLPTASASAPTASAPVAPAHVHASLWKELVHVEQRMAQAQTAAAGEDSESLRESMEQEQRSKQEAAHVQAFQALLSRSDALSWRIDASTLQEMQALVQKHTPSSSSGRKAWQPTKSSLVYDAFPFTAGQRLTSLPDALYGLAALSSSGVPVHAKDLADLQRIIQENLFYSEFDLALACKLCGELTKKTRSGFVKRYYVLLCNPLSNPNLMTSAAAGAGAGGDGKKDYYLAEYAHCTASAWGMLPIGFKRCLPVRDLLSIVCSSAKQKKGLEVKLTWKAAPEATSKSTRPSHLPMSSVDGSSLGDLGEVEDSEEEEEEEESFEPHTPTAARTQGLPSGAAGGTKAARKKGLQPDDVTTTLTLRAVSANERLQWTQVLQAIAPHATVNTVSY